MSKADNIYLIGLMGAGKTTIGRQLARTLRLPFYDSDKVIEENTGVDIPTIFEYEGEEGFRKRESKTLQQLTAINGIILATGGGAVLGQENRAALSNNGFVVYLHCSVQKILERTRRDNQRPLLQTEDPATRLKHLFQQREPLYQSCSDFEIDTGILHTKTVIKEIIKAFQNS